jgi:hypothetical protein
MLKNRENLKLNLCLFIVLSKEIFASVRYLRLASHA